MIVANLAAGNNNPGNAIKIVSGINDDSGTVDTSTDVKSYTMTHDVSTKGSFTGVSLAGTVYHFDPVLDGDDTAKLTAAIEGAILDAGFTYDNGDVRVSKSSNEVTIQAYPSSLVFTEMKGATSDTSFTAANSKKINVIYDEFNKKGYTQSAAAI